MPYATVAGGKSLVSQLKQNELAGQAYSRPTCIRRIAVTELPSAEQADRRGRIYRSGRESKLGPVSAHKIAARQVAFVALIADFRPCLSVYSRRRTCRFVSQVTRTQSCFSSGTRKPKYWFWPARCADDCLRNRLFLNSGPTSCISCHHLLLDGLQCKPGAQRLVFLHVVAISRSREISRLILDTVRGNMLLYRPMQSITLLGGAKVLSEGHTAEQFAEYLRGEAVAPSWLARVAPEAHVHANTLNEFHSLTANSLGLADCLAELLGRSCTVQALLLNASPCEIAQALASSQEQL